MIAFRHFLIISFLGFLVVSCSGTKVIDSWTNQSYTGKVDNIYIIGFVNEGWDRIIFENAFSARLDAEGVKSRPSHSYSPGYAEVERETTFDKIRSSGCDSVLLTRVVDQRTKAIFTTKRRSSNYSAKKFNGKETDYSLFPYDSLRINSNSSGIRITPKSSPTGTSFIVVTVESLLYDQKTETVDLVDSYGDQS